MDWDAEEPRLEAPTYNPSPFFPVPADWILRIDPFFYGGVAEMEGGWYGARSGDNRIPLGGPFDSFQAAREWVVAHARSALEAAQGRGMDAAIEAQRGLVDLEDEFGR